MVNDVFEKANAYDKAGFFKGEIDRTLTLLKDFRLKYPFKENPNSIEDLKSESIFKFSPDEVGEFFRYLEYYLKPLGHLTIYGSIVYQNIRSQIEDFKDLLRIVVDEKKSLAQKVDADWEAIKGLGGDKHVAKKIIFCFNHESKEILPIFSTAHLHYFVNTLIEKPDSARYYSLGQEYEYLMSQLFKAKEQFVITRSWEITHFARFLYNTYPPPDLEIEENFGGRRLKNTITQEQIDMGQFAQMLQILQGKQKINGQQFREYRDLWTKQPSEREALSQRLKRLLDR